ncbi:(2Fe-2S)-binding protein [Actinomadura sp. 6K520]|uniref:(2Fe-2S)-binding protein n=1 Tax=Actinomadura sp. 6K520 TaxID=2530364 RepID=UPI00104ED074|nr:(2Fe-2S)-binding protein [Actinomadura sp. 6K520]TDE32071.1 (2Fe-2S)-binding protein [Actinomadura sp. 6K520]
MLREAGRDDVAEVLGDVAALGPYFEIITGPAEVAGVAWRRFPDAERLFAATMDCGERLGTEERRVAASILLQGLASRLWSPVVAAAARGIVPDLAGLHWRWAPGESVALGLADPRGWRVAEVGQAADLIHPMVVDGHLRPLREMMLRFVSLADGLVWGNAASALAGSLNVGPPGGFRAELVRELLGRAPLADAGHFGAEGFVRRNCCLYYRAPGGGMCGDCGLLSRNLR